MDIDKLRKHLSLSTVLSPMTRESLDGVVEIYDEMAAERDAALGRVRELARVIDAHVGATGPCNDEFIDDTTTPYCSDPECTYCELVHSTDESSLARLYHEQRESKEVGA